ncbi:MAG: serine/threonine protein kinase [Phycisphaeraceae bacterium]|nr:serine/threonine protein kinase [Phycisphaeraceae bacterium]
MDQCPAVAQIEAWLALGEPGDAVAEHVAGCGQCASRAADLRSDDRLLHDLRRAEHDRASVVHGLPSIGGYTVVDRLSAGGQGAVYRAIQTSTGREVAIKVLHESVEGDERRQIRFHREVALISPVRHPGIVTVHDRGETDDGRAYFSMELVSGRPLMDHVLDMESAGVEDLLRLFLQVCDAVATAHQHGVIHRDLKPSNIMVDLDGHARVLDFGLARSIDDQSFPAVTAPGEFAGTLAYASPEQTRGVPEQVDAMTDVYALGHILYQMLTEEHPYPVDGPPAEVIRAINDVEPRPPSQSARGRARRLDTDIDTIVLRALSKDPARRYPSVAQLAEDVRRRLADQPILSRRDSSWYVLRKMVRRHRAVFAVVAVLLTALIAFSIAVTVLAIDLGRQRDSARLEARKARGVTEFLWGLFGAGNPERALGREVTMRDAVIAASERVDEDFPEYPDVRGAIKDSLGLALLAFDDLDRAEALLGESLRLHLDLYGADHPTTAASYTNLGMAQSARGKLEDAERSYRAALAIYRRRVGDRDRNTLAVMGNLTGVLRSLDRPQEAEELARETLHLREETLGSTHPETFDARRVLASILWDLGRAPEAESILKALLADETRTLDESHPSVLSTVNALAVILATQGKLSEAEPLFGRAVEIRSLVRGPSHQSTLAAMSNLGQLQAELGRLDQAEHTLAEVVRRATESLPPEHPYIPYFRAGHAAVLGELRRFDQAEPMLLESHAALSASLGDSHRWTTEVASMLADLYERWERPTDAKAWRDGPED